MNLDNHITLIDNIRQGLLSHYEATFISMCVEFALKNNVEKGIGTFGVEHLNNAMNRREPRSETYKR